MPKKHVLLTLLAELEISYVSKKYLINVTIHLNLFEFKTTEKNNNYITVSDRPTVMCLNMFC